MFLLDVVKPEDAAGKVAEAYSVFPEGIPVPEPLVMMSASPDLAEIQRKICQLNAVSGNRRRITETAMPPNPNHRAVKLGRKISAPTRIIPMTSQCQ